MSQGLSCIVPGPSLLPKEWPRDYQNVSQVHISDNKYVPGPYFWWSICSRACYFLSLVHHYYLKNGPRTIKPCPRSIFSLDAGRIIFFKKILEILWWCFKIFYCVCSGKIANKSSILCKYCSSDYSKWILHIYRQNIREIC